MERPRLLGGGEGNIIKEEKAKTVVIPLRKKRRERGIRQLFFAFLLGFFVVCFWVCVNRFLGDEGIGIEVFSEWFLKQGIGLPN